MIEIRGFKWPHRSTAVAKGHLLGEDAFGRWLGIAQGEPWWSVGETRSGVFESSFVKLVPSNTFWTACFRPTDPLIDVDIVLPVRWTDDVLEEVDLELDVLRFADGSVQIRDQEEFDPGTTGAHDAGRHSDAGMENMPRPACTRRVKD